MSASRIEVYGKKYPIQDCTSGACYPGYLWYNGYIPAYRINNVDPKTGKRRNLGTFKSRAAAEKHEKAVQFFKRR